MIEPVGGVGDPYQSLSSLKLKSFKWCWVFGTEGLAYNHPPLSHLSQVGGNISVRTSAPPNSKKTGFQLLINWLDSVAYCRSAVDWDLKILVLQICCWLGSQDIITGDLLLTWISRYYYWRSAVDWDLKIVLLRSTEADRIIDCYRTQFFSKSAKVG